MFCGKCGSELYPGAKFCGVCGAPAPGADNGETVKAPEANAADASDDVSLASSDGAPVPEAGVASQGAVGSQAGRARRRSRRRMPMALIVAIAILAIATAAAAAYLVYTQVVAPDPPAAERAAGDGGADAEADGAEEDADAETDEGSDAEADAADDGEPAEEAPAEEAPAEESAPPAEPVATHDYDCEYFTLDAPDGVTFTGAQAGGSYTWWISGPTEDGNGNLVWQGGIMAGEVNEMGSAGGSAGGGFMIYVGPNAFSSATGDYEKFGTTSDGMQVRVSLAGGSSIYTGNYGATYDPQSELLMTLK